MTEFAESPCYRDNPFRAGRDQLKNPATRAGFLLDQFFMRGETAADDQYLATTGAGGAKLNR